MERPISFLFRLIAFFVFAGVFPLFDAGVAHAQHRRPIPPTLELPSPNENRNVVEDARRYLERTDPEFIKEQPPESTVVSRAPGIFSRGRPDHLVYRCFFDESTDPNLDRWPDGWTRQVGLGFPEYLNIEIQPLPNPVNFRTFRIRIGGGKAMLRSPLIPVVPELSYTARAFVRTEGLQHNRVSVRLLYFDHKGTVLKQVAAPEFRDTNGWKEVKIGPVPADLSNVKTAQLRFLVAPGDRQDLQGNVDLAGIELVESPSVFLSTNNQLPIFTDPKGIEVRCRLSGLPTPKNRLTFTLENPFGDTLEENSTDLQFDDGPRDAFVLTEMPGERVYRGRAQWMLPIPGPGFYRVRVSTDGIDPQAETGSLALVVLEPTPPPKGGQFGWSLPNRTPKELRDLRLLLSQSGISWIKLPAWLGTQASPDDWEEFATFCEWLVRENGIQPVGLLSNPPPEIRKRIVAGPVNTASIFSLAPSVWYPSVEPSLMRLALIRYWQLGNDEDRSIVEIDPLLPQVQAIRKTFDTVAADSAIGFAWDWNRPVPFTFDADLQTERDRRQTASPEPPPIHRNGKEFLSLSSSDTLTSEELGEYLAASEDSNVERFVVLRPIDRTAYDLSDRITDLVRRMVVSKNTGAKAVFIPEPWNDDTGLLRADGTPGELFLPWRTTALMLSGKNHVGSISLPRKSTNMIFESGEGNPGDKSRQGVMMLWNDAASREEPIEETLFLGTDCELLDLWGKRVKPFRQGRDQIVPVGPLPIFVTRVDPTITRFRQGFVLEKNRIPSRFGPKIPNSFTFTNNSSNGISGTISMVSPPNWTLEPPSFSFHLSEGESMKGDFTIRLSPKAVSGSQEFRAELTLAGTAPGSGLFSVYDRIHVGEGDVYLEPPVTRYLERADELEVRQAFINDTNQALTFRCSLLIPGRQPEKMIIRNQGFGRHDHVYTLKNGKALLGKKLTILAREVGGERTLRSEFQANR